VFFTNNWSRGKTYCYLLASGYHIWVHKANMARGLRYLWPDCIFTQKEIPEVDGHGQSISTV